MIALAVLFPLALAVSAADALTFDAAIERASSAPHVRAAQQATAEKRDMDRRISSLTGNPQLSFQGGYRVTPNSERGPEGQLSLTQPVHLSRYGTARRTSAATETQALSEEARALVLNQRLSAGRAWCAVWGAQEAFAEARREVTLSEELQRRVQQAATLGALTRADVAEVRTYVAEARLAALSLEGESFDLSIELARVVVVGGPVRAEGPLPDLPESPTPDPHPTAAELSRFPTVALRRLLAQAEQSRLIELKAARAPLLQVGAMLSLQPSPIDSSGATQATQAWSLLGAAALTMPLFDRGERERGPLVASARKLAGEAQSEAGRAQAELALAWHEVEHSGEVLQLLREQLVPAAVDSAQLRELAFKAGDATVVEVLLARRAAAAARGRLKRAESVHAYARYKLKLLYDSLQPGDAR